MPVSKASELANLGHLIEQEEVKLAAINREESDVAANEWMVSKLKLVAWQARRNELLAEKGSQDAAFRDWPHDDDMRPNDEQPN